MDISEEQVKSSQEDDDEEEQGFLCSHGGARSLAEMSEGYY